MRRSPYCRSRRTSTASSWPGAPTHTTAARAILVYARAGNIMAAPFDLAALQVTGPPVVAVQGVATSSISGHAEFSLSQNGSLVYAPGRSWGADRRLLWVDRSGRTEPILDVPGAWEEPRISPDGRRLTLDADTAVSHVWVADLVRGSMMRLTVDGYDNGQPLWAPTARMSHFRGPRGPSWLAPPGLACWYRWRPFTR